MRQVIVQRPVTVAKLAEALGRKPFEVMADLIRRAVFPAPRDVLEDGLIREIAARNGVVLDIIDADDERLPEP